MNENMHKSLAPELQVSHWINTESPLSLVSLKGKVVVIEAFQMLCPGCVSHGLPQVQKVAALFSNQDVVVVGLHTVFEHHEAQGTVEALSAFLEEYRITFPVGIDTQSATGRLPKTMQAYNMQGTPTLLLIDKQGRLRKHKFGIQEDMLLGAEIATLLHEGGGEYERRVQNHEEHPTCRPDSGCS